MKSNTELKNTALAALKGNWAQAVGAYVLFALIIIFASSYSVYTSVAMQSELQTRLAGASGDFFQTLAIMQDPAIQALQRQSNAGSALSFLVSIFLLYPIGVGFANACKMLLGGNPDVIHNTFSITFEKYLHKVWTMFLMGLFIVLWSLMLIIPGIIKSFSYAMVPFIVEDNPELSADEAIDRSRAMMRGHKFDLFWLYLSFLGWAILAVIPAGLGFIWLVPYMETTTAAFYQEVKADYELNGGLI